MSISPRISTTLTIAVCLFLLSSCAQQAITPLDNPSDTPIDQAVGKAKIPSKRLRGTTSSQLIAEFENKIVEALFTRYQQMRADEVHETSFLARQTSKTTLSQREDLDADIKKLSQLSEQIKHVNQAVLTPKNKHAIRMHKQQLALLKHQLVEKRLVTIGQLGARYTGLVSYYTSQNRSAKSLLGEAKETIQQNTEQINKLRRQLSNETLASPLLSDLSRDKGLFLDDSPADKHLYLNLISDLIETASAKFTGIIAPPLDAPMEVRALAQVSAGTSKFTYRPAQITTGKSSILLVDLQNMQKLPLYEAEAKSFMYGIPGMHLLNTLILKDQSSSSAKFSLSDVPAFALGWGLYTANLAREYGLYQSRYGELGSLIIENRQASILISDINLNQKTWTDTQALEFLQETGYQTLQEAASVVARAHQNPGAQTSALAGFLAFRTLRSKSETRLGKKFSLLKFHRQILSSGPLPIYLIKENIEIWLNGISKSPLG